MFTKKELGSGCFRFVLALVVVLGHFSRINLGMAAVYVFFFLSGYWIQAVYPARYARTRRPVVTFIISRLWRILPIFFICSISAISICTFIPGGDPPLTVDLWLLLSSTIIFGYSSLSFRPVWTAWSLDIEVQFYLLAPLLCNLIRGSAALVLVFSVLASVSSILIFGDKCVFTYLPFFVSGMVASSATIRISNRAAAGFCGVLAVLVAIFWGLPQLRHIFLIGSSSSPLDAHYNSLLQVAVALCGIPIALWFIGRKTSSVDQVMGELSYIVYLVHSVVISLFLRLFPWYPTTPFGTRIVLSLSILAIVGVISWVLWLKVDRPLNRMRAAYVKSRIVAPTRVVKQNVRL